MFPTISVVIPFYNCAFVDRAIQSALQQTYPNVEVIVVNDGSDRYMEKIMPFAGRIRYVEKSNGGTATALNAGIRHATGSYFAWLSADDLFRPEKLWKQYRLLETSGGQFCHTGYVHIDEQDRRISGMWGHRFKSRLEMVKTLIQGCFINGSSVLLHMNLFDRFGLFDESLLYTHDYDFWLRILPWCEFHYLHEPLLEYRVHADMGTKKFAEQAIEEERRVREKHKPTIEKLVEQGGYFDRP